MRLRQIAVVAADLQKVGTEITGVLGVEACFTDPGVKQFGLKNTLWPIGTQMLEVVTPIAEGTAGGRYLRDGSDADAGRRRCRRTVVSGGQELAAVCQHQPSQRHQRSRAAEPRARPVGRAVVRDRRDRPGHGRRRSSHDAARPRGVAVCRGGRRPRRRSRRDVTTTDRAAILDMADRLGCAVGDDQVAVAGLRVNLV